MYACGERPNDQVGGQFAERRLLEVVFGGLAKRLRHVAKCRANTHFFHLVKNIVYFPLLVLKGIYHYWTYIFFLRGPKQMEDFRVLPSQKDIPDRSFDEDSTPR